MNRSWTFGNKIAAGFALSFVLLVTIGAIAYRSINTLSRASYSVAHTLVVLEHIAGVLNLLDEVDSEGAATPSQVMRALSHPMSRRRPRPRRTSPPSAIGPPTIPFGRSSWARRNPP